MISDFIAYTAGFLTTYAFWPQVVRAWKTDHTQGLSLKMYIIFSTGGAFWITYGLMEGLYTIVVPNVIKLILSLAILYRIIVNKRTKHSLLTNVEPLEK